MRWLRPGALSAFYGAAGRWLPWCWGTALLAGLGGLAVGLGIAPTDAQQGDAYRIIFIHVPAAWMSMVIYLALAFWAALGLLPDARLSSMMATALAPTGALMTFVALWTGSLWGKPVWGDWCVWDARVASELLLLLLYFAFMALQTACSDARRADRAGAVLALAGVVNLPIIYFSVQWWQALHPVAGDNLALEPGMASVTLAGMLLMVVALWAWSIGAVLHRVRSIVLEREGAAPWVQRLAEAQP